MHSENQDGKEQKPVDPREATESIAGQNSARDTPPPPPPRLALPPINDLLAAPKDHFDIPDYQLVRFLAEGGFGQVWLAKSRTGVYRAVKLLPRNERSDVEIEGIRNFERYARSHPNLISVLHVGETQRFFYYVLDLADGYPSAPADVADVYEPRTLEGDLKRHGRLELGAAITVTRQILAGLGYLHQQDLLHRDIKPANVLFVDGIARLGDVGLLTRETRQVHEARTPRYAPPEGVVNRSGDVYCVAKTLFEMIAGTRANYPNLSDTATPQQVQDFRKIRGLLRRACHDDPEKRFQSCEELLRALDALLEVAGDDARAPAGAVPSSPSATTMREELRRRRRAAILWLLGGTAALLILLVAFFQGGFLANPDSPAMERSSWGFDLLVRESETSEAVVLSKRHMPLLAGRQIRVRLDPGVRGTRYLYALSDSGQPAAVDAARWYPVQGPRGTLVFVLLVAAQRVDPVTLAERLARVGTAPDFDSSRFLRLEGGEILDGSSTERAGLGEPIRAVSPLFTRLYEEFRNDFEAVHAVMVPVDTE